MDHIQDTEIYKECKLKVKLWEHEFKKKHGRVPSKLDIGEADKEIRYAYKKYFLLKTAALEKSLHDVDLCFDDEIEENVSEKSIADKMNKSDETSLLNHEKKIQNHHVDDDKLINQVTDKVWGEHLLKQDQSLEIQKCSKMTSSFTEKLLKNCAPLKRFPRKSMSFHKRKSEKQLKEKKALSQPNPETSEYNTMNSNTEEISINPSISNEILNINNSITEDSSLNPVNYNQENVAFLTKFTDLVQNETGSKPTNLIQCLLSDKYKQRSSVDRNWLDRIIPLEKDPVNYNNEDVVKENIDYNSDDFIDKSSDDEKILHVQKKPKLIENKLCTIISDIDDKPKESLSSYNNLSEEKISSEKNQNILKKEISHSINTSNGGIANKKISSKTNCNRQNSRTLRKTSNVNFRESPETERNQCSDESSSDYETNDKKTAKKPSSRTCKKSNDINNDDNYELEYSVKTRIKSNPRLENVKKIISKAITVREKIKSGDLEDNTSTKKTSLAERKLLNKIESGKLNENFVSLNLKKKVFVRGKKNHNFTKYKKNQWKKMKKEMYGVVSNNCSTDRLSCFICGESGHWARNCPNKKEEALLPLEADETEAVCPTLEEAAEMAITSTLTVRKSNLDFITKSNDPCDIIQENDCIFEDELPVEILNEVDRLEEEVKKLDSQNYLDSTSFLQPYYQTSNGKLPETPKEVYNVLRKFGFSEFRPGQERAIMRILSGLSTLLTLSTGSGKSLCYQLPAYLYAKREPCITLVVSPLVSLMEDQVEGIPQFLKAACLHTGQTKKQKEKIQAAIDSGSLDVLLVSPEAVVAGEKSTGLGSLLRKLPPIAFACIDEVHCVSQWSHNFRPSYLMICRVLRERFGIKTLLGLTATATRSTCESIIKHLCIPDGREGVVSDVPLPNNLHLSVSRDFNRDHALLTLLSTEKYETCRSIIVYCTRRVECERIATLLRTNLREPSASGKKRKRYSDCAEAYHAGLTASKRKAIQKAFMNGDLRIVIATVAFGMGINKSDIRSVIHYNMPRSIESYVQEIGRAGRDGLPSYCHLFLNAESTDEFELRRHVFADAVDRYAIRKLIQKLFIPCSCKSRCTRHEVAFSVQETVQFLDIPEENIATLLCYLELHPKKFIEVLSQAYINCKVVAYGDANYIAKASKECVPLAMALALFKEKVNGNIFEFPVIDVAAAIGWDSGICKHKLKNLEWISENGQPKRSKLNVQFSNLGFRIFAPGNLTDDELNEALEYLSERTKKQEKYSLLQINCVKNALASIAVDSVRSPLVPDVPLKTKICDYFENDTQLENIDDLECEHEEPIDEGRIASDTRALINLYRDNNFTGRAVARIFHGIQSPNYPAFEWGRCKFWRAHLKSDFNAICGIATKEILR